MTGAEVKSLIIDNGIKLWKVAEALGVEDYYFSRRLRKPFDEEEVSRVKAAIEQVKQQEAKTKTPKRI